MHSKLTALKNNALNTNVPIISDEGLLVLIKHLSNYNKPKVLEIGTAIGYCAIALAINGAYVTSIEKNIHSYELALSNVNSFNLNDQITLLNSDATIDPYFTEEFDIIFIDAAKAQYEKFFNIYEKYLSKNGIIVCDNLNFHNLDPALVNRNTRQLINKITKFKDFLNTNKAFNTIMIDDGDGMSISKRI